MSGDPLAMPQDLAVERAILGAVLVEPSHLDAVVDAGLKPRHLVREAHREILSAFLAIRESGRAPDLIGLRDALGDRLESVGGMVYLSGLTDGVPRSSNVASYASGLVDLARRRELIAALQDAAIGVRRDGPTADVIAPLSALLSAEEPTEPGLAHERRVVAELAAERIRRVARRRLDAEERGAVEIPELETLSIVLARPMEARQDRIEGWQPMGSNVVLNAQAKTGKTTARDNYVRSLVDGVPFLGRYAVRPVVGSVVVLDFEMGERQGLEWLRAQQIRHADRVVPAFLRGRGSSFNILDATVRTRWAERLRDCGAEVIVADCLRPMLDALGLDEHRDAGRFLVAFDALKAEAGIRDALVIHHMGHVGERARGDSRIRDWPDVEWQLVRETEAADSARFIKAYGRDVEQPEQRLEFDKLSRRLQVAGGSRQDSKIEAALDAVVSLLATSEPLSGRAIKSALADSGISKHVIEEALGKHWDSDGRLTREAGLRGAKLYRLKSDRPGVSRQRPGDGVSQCPAPFKGGDAGTLETEEAFGNV